MGYLGYCPCNWMDPAGPWSVFLNAAEREFFQDYIPRFQRKERDGGTKGDLKEQAQRHCHAHSTATTPLVPPQPGGHGHPGGTEGLFQHGAVGLCQPTLPQPSTSPSLTPARSQHPREHPGVQGTHHRAPVFFQEPGRHQAPPAAGAPAAVPSPAQNRASTQIWGFSG